MIVTKYLPLFIPKITLSVNVFINISSINMEIYNYNYKYRITDIQIILKILYYF